MPPRLLHLCEIVTFLALALALSLPVQSLVAQASPPDDAMMLAAKASSAEDQAQYQELLAVLEEETDIATKTKMNQDFVPGMVTVLHRYQLEALGVRDVAEALSLVPGIQIAYSKGRAPTPKVRGIAFPFNAGNLKVMLNSIALSRESSGINSSVLLTPVSQVDRIEIIRGPGSVIHGEFALTGVVNIITSSKGGRAYGRLGDDESRLAGGHYSYISPDQSLSLGLNASYLDGGESAARLESDPESDQFVGVLGFRYHDFSLTVEGVRREQDLIQPPPLAGPLPGPLPPPVVENTFQEETSWAVEGRQRFELGPDLEMEGHLSFLRNEWRSDHPGFEFMGDRVEVGLDCKWSPRRGHQLLVGLSYTYSTTDDAINESQDEYLRVSGVDRSNYGLAMQYQMPLGERLNLTMGLRFDHYEMVGSRLTPQVAAVYRLGEHHVVKAQYSEGFRPPTFWEIYFTGEPNSDLEFEVIRTVELAYIYRRPDLVGRVTLFHSRMDDVLYQLPQGGFGNNEEIRSQGVELEWEQKLGERFRWLANLTYVDAQDSRTSGDKDQDAPGVANWLGNLALFWRPAPKYMVTGRWLHVGERYLPLQDADGFDTLDLTLSRTDLFTRGLTLRAGVLNLLDDDIFYFQVRPNGIPTYHYRGRTFWLQLSYDF